MKPEVIGLTAGFLTSVAALPQLVRTLKTRQVRDISLGQPLLLSIGIFLWLVYGILQHDLPLVIANIIPLICNLWLTFLKFRWGDDKSLTRD